jgi:hypothetical protein
VFVGATKAGVVTTPHRVSRFDELQKVIQQVDPTGIYFSPNMAFENGKLIDAIQRLVPESKSCS